MAEDIVPGLLEKVQSDYRKLRENDEKLARISERTAAGSADGKDLDAYAVREGELLAEALRRNVSSDILPNGKMYFNIANRVLPPVLKENYGNVADMSQRIITGMNNRAGIHIKAQRPELNEDRVKGLVNLAATAEQYDDRQKELEGDVVNFSQSVGTDTVRKNADFQYQAGLSPKIHRTAEGGCCKWCSGLSGTYDYGSVKGTGNEVWQRHRDCRCVVEFDPGNGRRQNAHTKQYSWKEENAEKVEERKNNWFNTLENRAIMRYRKEGAFNSNADPMADAFGPGIVSNPIEIEQFREECKKYGVDIIERENESLNYQPNPRVGNPGQLCVSKGASYGAWLHEMQHMHDDRDCGWNGSRAVWDIEEHIAWEERAYGLEIALAEKLGRKDVADLLRANLEAEKKRLYGSE